MTLPLFTRSGALRARAGSLLSSRAGRSRGVPFIGSWLSVLLSAFLAGCAMETSPPGAGLNGSGTEQWPKRITLATQGFTNASDGVQLADGAIVAGEGDLSLWMAQQLSLTSPSAGSICDKGRFATLADVPTDTDGCPGASDGAWVARVYLSASSVHTSEESYAIGLGLLLRNEEHTALYRLRVLGDSRDTQDVGTATFDYEPVP